MCKIQEFTGKYACFSNSAPCIVEYDGMVFLNSEAAYQSAKTVTSEERVSFTVMAPETAILAGKKLKVREDWEGIKYRVLYDIVKNKFYTNEKYRDILLSTGDVYIGEDAYCCSLSDSSECLGEILMSVRDWLKARNS